MSSIDPRDIFQWNLKYLQYSKIQHHQKENDVLIPMQFERSEKDSVCVSYGQSNWLQGCLEGRKIIISENDKTSIIAKSSSRQFWQHSFCQNLTSYARVTSSQTLVNLKVQLMTSSCWRVSPYRTKSTWMNSDETCGSWVRLYGPIMA